MTSPIIFLDANTVWHLRLAEALAKSGPVVAINPASGAYPKTCTSVSQGLKQVMINLPRGWASSSAFIGQRILHRHVRKEAHSMGGKPLIVLTSPVYAPLAERISGEFPIISYTSDDYRSYSGWGGNSVVTKERRINLLAELSVFVSETLRERAIREFGLGRARTLLSPNATERRFADHVPANILAGLAGRSRPVVGVLGALTNRLNIEVLAAVAASPKVGTFLVAGPASDDLLKQYEIFRSPKCIIAGQIDHSNMHLYAQALDVALIAYARTQLNYHCSPLRLYDHLATGVPIVALAGCHQIDHSRYDAVQIVGDDQFLIKVEELLAGPILKSYNPPSDCFWDARALVLREAFS